MNNSLVEYKKAFFLEAINRGYTCKEISSIFSISSQGVHSYISSIDSNEYRFNQDLIPDDIALIKGKLSKIDPIIICLEIIKIQEESNLNLKQAINVLKKNGISFKESSNRITYNNIRYKNLNELLKDIFPNCPSENVFFYEINKYKKETGCTRNEAIDYAVKNKDKIFNRGFIFEGKTYKNKKEAIVKLIPSVKYENVCSLISQYQRIYKISRDEAFSKAIDKYKKVRYE